ncbi:phage portal protein [Streptomyces sp. NPDC048157]|uniref:phage portal protein n=1 Tax=Streptomyces sp. NPDC048157 TaxID=3365503 RepID=UPI0037163801
MPIDPVEAAKTGLDGLAGDRVRLDRVDDYDKGKHDPPYMPPSADAEYRLLAERAVTNWVPLIIKTPAQSLAVESYRHKGKSDETAPEWAEWQRNRMDARQNAVHRAALLYGQSFVTVIPDRKKPGRPVLRGVSPRRMWAGYTDPATDEFPVWAFEMEKPPTDGKTAPARLYDDTFVYELTVGGPKPLVRTRRKHGVTLDGEPVCPVVRFAIDIDLEGRVTGVVEPVIPIQNRINQSVFDLLVAQTFGSFKVRTIAGMAPPVELDADGKPVLDRNGRPKAKPITADAARFLVAKDPDTKFGTLDETPLDGFINAIELSTKHFAAVTQTPPHMLLGSLINLSAEALAAAEAAKTRFDDELKHVLGESWEAVFALMSSIMGLDEDREAQVAWKDVQSRSMAQLVDALGKAAQMLQVPVEILWSKIPGLTAADIEEARELRERQSDGAQLANALTRAQQPKTAEVPTDAAA